MLIACWIDFWWNWSSLFQKNAYFKCGNVNGFQPGNGHLMTFCFVKRSHQYRYRYTIYVDVVRVSAGSRCNQPMICLCPTLILRFLPCRSNRSPWNPVCTVTSLQAEAPVPRLRVTCRFSWRLPYASLIMHVIIWGVRQDSMNCSQSKWSHARQISSWWDL